MGQISTTINAPHEAAGSSPTDDSGTFNFDMSKCNYFGALFIVLLDAMTVRQNTVLSESKEISSNASIQNKLNNLNAGIKFSILADGATIAEINRVQDQNQQYAALREDIQNALITARQRAQVTMTRTSTDVNLLQQDATEDSGGVLQTLRTIFEVINEINKR